jgi:hypothetical protein
LNLFNVTESATFGCFFSVVGTRRSRTEQGQVSRGVGHNHHFIVIQKGGILLMLQMFNKDLWQLLTAFLLKILDSVSGSGSSPEIVASNHMGSTWKVTEVSNLYEYFKYIFFNSGNFCVPPHICVRLCLIMACEEAKM